MAIIDENFPPDPRQISPLQTGLKYGIILVFVGLVFQIVANLIGLGVFLSGTISLAISIGVIVFAIRNHRDNELGGFISFRRGLAVCFWMGISYGLVVALWVFYNNSVNGSETNELQQRELDKIRAQVEDGEVPPEMLEYSQIMVEAVSNPIFMMTMAWLSILFIGLFVSLFTKRERPLV